MMIPRAHMVIFGLSLLGGCDDGGGRGELAVQIFGEEYIEAGIPAAVFADGWSVRFDQFLVSVGEVGVAEGGAGPAVGASRYQIFDLAADSGGMGQRVAAETVPAGEYDETRFMIAPSASPVAGNASAQDVALMKDGGFSVYVAGSASKAEETLRFAWGFHTRTQYEHCESKAVVTAQAPATVQLTIHGDHLFYDDLFSETPSVRFALIAGADSDKDGEVTRAELAAVDLRPLSNYQVGSADITDLWHFVEHLTSTLGHIDGEGHCESVREE